MSDTKLVMSTEMFMGVDSLGATAGVTMLLTLSHLPPSAVAASAFQWRVMPPVFLRITVWSGELVPPTKALKSSCVLLKSICAAPATQSEKAEVFSPAADAVAVMFWPAGILKGAALL